MKILPFERYSLPTNLGQEELYRAIDEACRSRGFAGPRRSIHGRRDGNDFKVYRAIRYQNTFLPYAFGRIQPDGGRASVDITLRMNLFAIVFMLVWLGGTFGIALVEMRDINGGEPKVPFIMCGAGYLLMQAAFWYEASRIKSLVEKMVYGQQL
ncbi:hypothetical protein [uncultured Pseudoteredinibacter sp.]|uniref:hypothetical protein n=1 Tax=uncultured Pseudoteredinibacter sp. TaxID=1641701 RepID=UPI00262A0E0C|nr:hypothetical protein [uncultured Pseudoteredinibacter sp.]